MIAPLWVPEARGVGGGKLLVRGTGACRCGDRLPVKRVKSEAICKPEDNPPDLDDP